MERQIRPNEDGETTSELPELQYLHAFLGNPQMGNSVCIDRQSLAHESVILERRNETWRRRYANILDGPWNQTDKAQSYVVAMNYFEPREIRSLAQELGINAKVFQAHMHGCEQHFTGTWEPSNLTTPPYLRADRYESGFVTFDYRKRYPMTDSASLAAFESSRKQRCTLLRSHHLARSADSLFEHERCTIAWSPAISERPWGRLSKHHMDNRSTEHCAQKRCWFCAILELGRWNREALTNACQDCHR